MSSVTLRIEEEHLNAQLTLTTEEVATFVAMDTDDDGRISAAEFELARPAIEALALEMLAARFDGVLVPPQSAEARYLVTEVHFHVAYPKGICRDLRIESTLLPRLARGHRQYIELLNDEGVTKADRMLDANNNAFEIELSRVLETPSQARAFWRFLVLGVEHIWTGYDHVAFLIALMIVGVSFRSVAIIITAFTVAHSITLALATLDIVRIPGSVVEPLIAATILYVGLENIFHRNLKWRWLLTFFFGMVHGLGFASVLRDLGIGVGSSSGVTLPLVSFNVGVELGQIAIAAAVLPLVWRLRKLPSFVPRYVPACSLLVALAGGYWLIERTLLK